MAIGVVGGEWVVGSPPESPTVRGHDRPTNRRTQAHRDRDAGMHGPGDVRFFDRLAVPYDLAMPSTDPRLLEAGFDLAGRPVETVLDVGGGTGRAAKELAVARPVVVDASRGMLRRARDRGLACVTGDAGRLPVADASVDAVVVLDALHHFPDPPAAVAEAARVLAPGGVLVVREFDPGTIRGRGLVAVERVARMGSTFYRVGELESILEGVGLATTVLESGFEYTVAGVRDPAVATDPTTETNVEGG
jgi:demethylmenaquinone methyltransferase/2-methoxy-6-polyprenyl-1,4-benzoquinol methylase